MIKAVVFDLDGVFFAQGTEVFIEKLMGTFNLSRARIEDVYFKSEQMQQYKRGETRDREFWDFAIEQWGIQSTMEELVEMLISSYDLNSEVSNYIQALKDQSIKIAACTNNFAARIDGLSRRFNLDSVFDVIVPSNQVGVTKPSQEIFERLAAQLDLHPEEILMSDDRQVNVDSLEKLGFKAFLFTNLDDFINKVNSEISPKQEGDEPGLGVVK